MSSIRQRRANPNYQPPNIPPATMSQQLPPPQYQQLPPQQPIPQSNAGLSLQQVIDIYGKRLIQLENFMNISSQNSAKVSAPTIPLVQIHEIIEQKFKSLPPIPEIQTAGLSEEMLAEFNNRFEILAEELVDLKNIVLNLQTYTMSVNKKLLEQSEIIPASNNDEPFASLGEQPKTDAENNKDTENNITMTYSPTSVSSVDENAMYFMDKNYGY